MKTKKLTLCAMLSALAATLMLSSYFPYLTYGIPAMAGIFVMVAVIEVDIKWSIGVYLASSLIALLTAEREAMLFYIAFFGFYPILKSLFERLRSRLLEYILKIVSFNLAVALSFGIMILIGLPVDFINDFGVYTIPILLVTANIAFVLYDLALSRIAGTYIARISPAVNKIIRGK